METLIETPSRQTGRLVKHQHDAPNIKMIANDFLQELLSQKLEVVLIPAPEQRHDGHCIRAVQEENPKWYQKFCSIYQSNRKGTRVRTKIKRRETIKALEALRRGASIGCYSERLISFIENYKEFWGGAAEEPYTFDEFYF